jgi:hypothetical protein
MRNIVFSILPILAVSILVLSGCGSKEPKPESNPEAEKAAIESATVWLQLMDSEKYVESWEEAAEYLKNAVSKDNFQTSLQTAREPLGKLVSRNLKSKVYSTSAPGAPDGEYVIIQYNTSFENKKSAIETVTPMRDKDSIWRVSGYYIR